MQQIINHNCTGLCVQEFCSNDEQRFEVIEFNGLRIFVALCDRHSSEWEDNFWGDL